MRILVVDDEPDLVAALARGLKREGYAVDTATSGEEALAKASWNPYDLVCLDLNMPDLDGLEVCDSLRTSSFQGITPRVLMLTARDTIEDRIQGLDVGADDYLVKPFSFEELAARVRSLLRRDSGRTGSVIEIGPLLVDTSRNIAKRGERLLELTSKDFYYITKRTLELSKLYCNGKVVSILEGGYDIKALQECSEMHVNALLEFN